MNKSKFIAMVISLFFSVAANVSQATDGIICSGTISILGLHTTDKVMLKLSGMNTVVQICDLNKTLGSSNPVSAEQCKAAYSTLLTAYSLNKSLSIYFDNVGTGTSCSTFAGWEVATARWIPLTSD